MSLDLARQFLLSKGDPAISEAELLRELEVPVFCFRRLASLFRLSCFTQRLTDILGGVLSDLPFEIFDSIRRMTNLYFFYDDGKVLASVEEIKIEPWQASIIKVSFSQKSVEFSDFALRGIFAHELGHVDLGHYSGSIRFQTYGEREDEADRKAVEWGFSDEIRAIRDNLKTFQI